MTNIASVESMNGAPRIAPTPISSDDCAGREDDRDDRDQGLGERRTDRGEHGADGPFRQVQGATEPLDPVGEQLRADQDDDERDQQDEQVQRWGSPGSLEREAGRIAGGFPNDTGGDVDFGVARSSFGQGTERRMTSVPTGGQP